MRSGRSAALQITVTDKTVYSLLSLVLYSYMLRHVAAEQLGQGEHPVTIPMQQSYISKGSRRYSSKLTLRVPDLSGTHRMSG